MEDALDQNGARIKPGPDAPAVATCLACGVTVNRHSPSTHHNPDEQTQSYRHRPAEETS